MSQRVPIDEALGREFHLILIPGRDGEGYQVAVLPDSSNYWGPLLMTVEKLPFWAEDHPAQRATCVPQATLDEIRGHSSIDGVGDLDAWLKSPRFLCKPLRVKLVAVEEVPGPLPPTPPARVAKPLPPAPPVPAPEPMPPQTNTVLTAQVGAPFCKDPNCRVNHSYFGFFGEQHEDPHTVQT